MSQFCIHLSLQKTTQATRLDWEREVERGKQFPTFDRFMGFMDVRLALLALHLLRTRAKYYSELHLHNPQEEGASTATKTTFYIAARSL